MPVRGDGGGDNGDCAIVLTHSCSLIPSRVSVVEQSVGRERTYSVRAEVAVLVFVRVDIPFVLPIPHIYPGVFNEDLNIPILGINMPNMGTKVKSKISRVPKRKSLADALFASTQQRVLAFLFGQPERSYFATELIGLVGAGSGAVQRELSRLADSGLVNITRVGTQKHYQANPQSPIFAELCAITQKTVGLAEPIRDALAPLAKDIMAAFVYGSVAKRTDTATSDIDVLVLSDRVDYADVFSALQSAEIKLGRTINPTVYSPADWRKKHQKGNAFVAKVSEQPKLFIIGTEEMLG